MTLEGIEKRVRALEDAEEIKTMHREYLFYIQNLDIDKALDCFAETIVTDVANYGIFKGKKDVGKFFREIVRNNVLQSKDGHFTGQPVVSVEGDKAKGHWMFYRFLAGSSQKQWIQGRYDCEYVKENGEWKFSLLKMKRPWPEFLK
jgi:ketosteroid isomerase-like protein